MMHPVVKIDRTVKVGDILTSATILISITSLLYTWNADQQLRRREQANRIRVAAASSLVKFDAWKSISLSFFDEALVAYDDLKQQLLANYTYEPNRNHLWKRLLELQVEVQKAHLDDDVQGGLMDLYTYNPTVRPEVETLLRKADDTEREAFGVAREQSQDVLSNLFYGAQSVSAAEYHGHSADLYNKFAEINEQERQDLRNHIESLFKPSIDALKHLISLSDDELLANSKVPLNLTK